MNIPRFSKVGLAAILGLMSLASAGIVTVDANSGASIKMSTGTCTSNSASITWTMTHQGGTWRVYYGTTNVAAPSTAGWATTLTPSGRTISITGLTANTKYYGLVAGWQGGVSSRAETYLHVTFTTDAGTSSILPRASYGAARPSVGYDAFGRRMGRVPQDVVNFGQGGVSQFDPAR
jgi:hypothetical protein